MQLIKFLMHICFCLCQYINGWSVLWYFPWVLSRVPAHQNNYWRICLTCILLLSTKNKLKLWWMLFNCFLLTMFFVKYQHYLRSFDINAEFYRNDNHAETYEISWKLTCSTMFLYPTMRYSTSPLIIIAKLFQRTT